MTPTPIPEWFRAWAKRYADGNSIDAHPRIREHLNAELYEAAINTYRLLSSQWLQWVKDEAPDKAGHYYCKIKVDGDDDEGRKIIEWDGKSWGEIPGYDFYDGFEVLEWLLEPKPTAPIQ